MTALLFEDPRFVHLHIPKTGGTSIRNLMAGRKAKRAFGHIPLAWQGAPVLVVVRDPVARFLSAVNMFRLGTPDVAGHYATPSLPDLSVDAALDILCDDRIAFDRSVRYPQGNLRHHLMAQTHPYNCLHLATDRIRLERLSVDWARLAKRLNLPADLGTARKTRALPGAIARADLSAAQLDRLAVAYAADFEVLGYGLDGGFARIDVPAMPDPTTPGIWGQWPGYFSDIFAQGDDPATALPAPNGDLTLFLQDRIVGPKAATWVGRKPNLAEHFHELQPEFSGCRRLAHLLACTICVLRRAPDCDAAASLFHRITSEHGALVAGELNTRWLTSVCDTLVDIGQTPQVRAMALAGSLLANTAKLYETERRVYSARLTHPPQRRIRQGGPMFDGVVAFGAAGGDMIENMIGRAASLLKDNTTAAPFLGEILSRMLSADTAYRRFVEMAGQPLPPLATVAERAALRAALVPLNRATSDDPVQG